MITDSYHRLSNLMPHPFFEDFLTIGTERTLDKGEEFVRAGEIPRKVAFVLSGLFRYYYIDKEGVDYTKSIILEGSMLASYSAMINASPSYFFIQALEPAHLLEVNWNQWNQLQKKDRFWDQFLIKMLEKGFVTKERRERELLLWDAETRYRSFLEHYPRLENRLTQRIVASYLGIHPESLSRIRKKLKALT